MKLINIHKEFIEPSGILKVLRGVSLNINQGEIVLVEGPSGSGKTTLLQIAGLLLHPSDGEIELNGLKLGQASEQERIVARRKYLGFVFQHFNLFSSLNVYDNVILGLRFKRLPIDQKQVMRLLETLGIESKARKTPKDLSGGEKQRVAIARGLVGHPQLLLADEPSSQLDSGSAEILSRLLRQVAKEMNSAVLISTHDPRLRGISDRICILREGIIYE